MAKTSTKRTSKKRRVRKPPGVWVSLKPPNPKSGTWWRSTYVCPDLERRVYVTLPRELTTEAMRLDWRDRLSMRLLRRKQELEAGGVRLSSTPIPEAIERYYKAHPRLRERAVATYQPTTDKFIEWAKGNRVKSTDDLTQGKCFEFRELLVNQPKHSAAEYSRRGSKWPTSRPRSPHTINREFKVIRSALRYLVDAEVCARLTHDGIRRAFKNLPVPDERKDFLKPAEIRALLAAAIEHDADCFAATREEIAGHRQRGSTYRYDPMIAPVVLFTVLTGMRVGEVLSLDWKDVRLEDDEIRIGKQSKTHKAREVGLDVAPVLRRLLAAQKLRTGGKGSVWGLSQGAVNAARRRLLRPVPKRKNDAPGYGAPKFTYQVLRVTCQSYLASAPSIYAGASIFLAARRGGHSVAVCEKHYAGAVKNISREARTLESAMQIEDLANLIVESVSSGVRALPKELRAG